jgi:hypothetical protein
VRSDPLLNLSVITVAVQDESGRYVDVLLDGLPLPMMEIPIPLRTIIPLVQVQDPTGMMMVSPLTAVCVGPFMTAFTSLRLHDAAVKVPCERAGGANAIQRTKSMTIVSVLIILSWLSLESCLPPLAGAKFVLGLVPALTGPYCAGPQAETTVLRVSIGTAAIPSYTSAEYSLYASYYTSYLTWRRETCLVLTK